MIDWDTYRDTVSASMADNISMSPIADNMDTNLSIAQLAKQAGMNTAEAIVNGYVSAVSAGGDPIIKAAVVLNSVAVASFLSSLSQLLSSPDPTGLMVINSIVANIPLCWTGASLNAAAQPPLPGHISHFPISSVISPGVMPLFSIPPASAGPDKYVFIDNMIAAMKAHLLTVGGIHPAMILPPPAPPYPLPWTTYI